MPCRATGWKCERVVSTRRSGRLAESGAGSRVGNFAAAVSNWQKTPAEQVLAVEALTGVPRTVLRPDLYPMSDGGSGEPEADEVDLLRSHEYGLLAILFGRAPARCARASLGLKGDASPLGLAHIRSQRPPRRWMPARSRGILRPVHRGRARRAPPLRLLLLDRLPASGRSRGFATTWHGSGSSAWTSSGIRRTISPSSAR